ncbi:MAG: S8 family peptidase [Wenzhouxiangella sp.]|nr:S8 family peptidase [Wenzhouxiangella sp.]TVR97410.1 MAG: S8 family peptidase [Wenzhouxiangellaceae bacterium]
MHLKKLYYPLIGAALLAFSLSLSANNQSRSANDSAGGVQFHAAEFPIKGQYIVVLRDEVASLASERGRSEPSVSRMAADMARQHGFRVEHAFSHVLRGFAVEADARALRSMMQDQRIAFIEEDSIVTVSQTTQPNATWGLDRVDQRDLPLDGNYVYDTTAAGVYTYIVDTGVRPTHVDFGNRVLSGFTSINDGRGSNDCNGHGTHVAGTVAGSTWGVAKGAFIVPVRVLGCNGGGTNSGVIAGMDWIAANHTKPAVANMSLGGGASTATDNAVTNMRNAGVTVVVAAGNENQNACNVSPARAPAAITVGSTASNDTRSNFSNWGSCVDIFAPGSSIRSAWHTSNTATNTISGTSMAAPHVAGVAALFLANNPNATPTQVENAIYGNGSTGKLSGINTGSPNLLVYSRFGSGGGSPDPEPEVIELENGTPVGNLSGAQGSERFFTIDVPDGATDLVIQISGGSGDADLYVRRGAPPTQSTYDCRPYLNGNNETCTFASPQAGTYHIMLHAWAAYSGVTLVASFEEPASNNELENGQAVTGLSGGQGSEQFFTMEVPANVSELTFQMSGGSGDADLYVRRGAPPTTSTWDCRPYLNGNNETCTFNDPQAGTWHVMIRGYTAYSNVSLVGSYQEGPTAPCTNCDQYSGSLSGTSNAQVQPNGTWYQAGAGIHRGWLQGPGNANFDLELYRWNGSRWVRVARAATADSNEFIQYNGSAGFYYWRVVSASGSGAYDLWLQTP